MPRPYYNQNYSNLSLQRSHSIFSYWSSKIIDHISTKFEICSDMQKLLKCRISWNFHPSWELQLLRYRYEWYTKRLPQPCSIHLKRNSVQTMISCMKARVICFTTFSIYVIYVVSMATESNKTEFLKFYFVSRYEDEHPYIQFESPSFPQIID